MMTIDELTKARDEAEAFANDHGFAFMIFRGTRYEFRGHKSEERDATEEEQELWTALGGPHAYFEA